MIWLACLQQPALAVLPTSLGPLLAQQARWSRLGDRFTKEGSQIDASELLAGGAILVAFVLLLVGLRWLQQWQATQRQQGPHRSPSRNTAATDSPDSHERSSFSLGYDLANTWKTSHYPRHLFNDLCKVHRLRRNERRQLLQLAQHQGLSLEAELFVRPDYFQADNFPDALQAELLQYQQLARKLFSGLPQEPRLPSPIEQLTS